MTGLPFPALTGTVLTMGRSKRIDYPGAWHHVMNRGARRAAVFARPTDCDLFLEVLSEVVERFQLQVHAYSVI